jgi:hypothetical protein
LGLKGEKKKKVGVSKEGRRRERRGKDVRVKERRRGRERSKEGKMKEVRKEENLAPSPPEVGSKRHRFIIMVRMLCWKE